MSWNFAANADPRRAASAYASVAVETGVASADGHRLVLMLFDGVLRCISEARGHLARRDMAAKGLAISRALRIIDEGLVASLDESSGGDIALQLKSLYAWIGRRLALANLKGDEALLEESARLLNELRAAWQEIGSRGAAMEHA